MLAKVALVRILYTRSGSIVILLSPKHKLSKLRSKILDEPKMHDEDKTCFLVFRPASLCPDSYAMNNGRQMRMTDRDTPHALKIMLTSTRPRQTKKILLKDR